MQDEFSEKIKEWVSTDNMVRLYLDKIRELRAERNEIAENIAVSPAGTAGSDDSL